MVLRIYAEKKPGFDGEAVQLMAELRLAVAQGISPSATLRIVNRYDVEGIDEALFEQCIPVVFSEPQVDRVSLELPATEGASTHIFAVEALPGQFDQRAASASECIQLVSQGERPEVRYAKVYIISGELTQEAFSAIKHYLINPVETREASLEVRDTLKIAQPQPAPVAHLDGFLELDEAGLRACIAEYGLAMDFADILFTQKYFASEGRCPTITEIKMIDTYWSDHCRHTTFGTRMSDVVIDDARVQAAFERYQEMRHELGRDEKPVCLMDMGTIGAKWLKAKGILRGLDESEEINACTVKCKVDVDGVEQDWLYLFKNETHNHPTEIEPFGGAATCLGGAIRDPLSGRSYVYQAMRVTGAGNPLAPIGETLPGKLPQRKLVTTAAAGYASYGNQIGLSTGQVSELYHPGYVAKRMEIGAVVAATPASFVRRETPAPGDVVVLLGGRTGRDGIGGATGSSKEHNLESLETCGAEVQKGNPPEERKIQRLFRRGEVCRLIKRCNDFGAGGVSVAIGELADGLRINLDAVPKKYEGLDGTELAISESQERMACAIAAKDVDEFLSYAREENLEANVVATVTDDARVRLLWHDEAIVDVSREFLASNGAPKEQKVHVSTPQRYERTWAGHTLAEKLTSLLSDLNVCSNKGLSERFDSTIGAASVLMPFGGTRQLTPAQAMVAKIPCDGETATVSGMAWGFNPYLSEADQFAGAYIAVVESVSRLVASGFAHKDIYLSFQEYFESLRGDELRWGKPTSAVLGALMAQLDIGVAAIGGKDSMSGSFENLDVPPTLVSFATAIGKAERITSPEFKCVKDRIVWVRPAYKQDGILPDTAGLLAAFELVESLIEQGSARAVSTPGYGCVAESLFKMCVGNGLGVELNDNVSTEELFAPAYGSFLVELDPETSLPESTPVESVDGVNAAGESAPGVNAQGLSISLIGTVSDTYEFRACGEVCDMAQLQEVWESTLEPVYPYRSVGGQGVPTAGDSGVSVVDGLSNSGASAADVSSTQAPKTINYNAASVHAYSGTPARPRVIIPVFPGTNCEYDTARAFERAGAIAETLVVNNLTPDAVAESTRALARAIKNSQIVMIPGGFSGGDEPEGSAKFIAAAFRAPEVTEAVRDLLQHRDGLMLGICNGFQALIKLGLVPFGDIRPMDETCPTLTFNTIGRHQSKLVRTRVASNLSPWLSRTQVGEVHTVAISHGEGRFVASAEMLAQMEAAGQIATQYVDATGAPSMELDVNPNGSVWAIEGITSADGRVFGKMGHSERSGAYLYKNVPGNLYQPIFEGGVSYFMD